MNICMSISDIGSIGALIAALVAVGTLFEIRWKRLISQKPRLLFKNLAHSKVNWDIDKNGINSSAFFDMINGGSNIARDIQINYKWNVDEFFSIINKYDIQKESPFTIYNGVVSMTLASYPDIKYRFEKQFIDIKLEYLLPLTLVKELGKLNVPNDFLAFVSFLIYLIEKANMDFSAVGVPTIHVGIKFKDVSGKKGYTYRSIFVTYTQKSGVQFWMAPSNKRKYNKANMSTCFYGHNKKSN